MALGAVYYNFMNRTKGVAYMYGDITTNNIQCQGTDNAYQVLIDASYALNDVFVLSFWSNHYSVINLANNFVNKATSLGKYDEKIKKQHIAEAKFIRAISYFNLLKIYGNDALTGDLNGLEVPLQLKEYDGTGIESYIPRNTNDEVYELIIADLKSASTDLPLKHKNLVATVSRATQNSAKAMLSRVYLYKRDYANCAQLAKEVIDSKVYSLATDLRKLFPSSPRIGQPHNFTTEDIFNLPISANRSNTFKTSTNQGKNEIYYRFTNLRWVSDDLINTFETKDNRKIQLIVEGWEQSGAIIEGFDNNGVKKKIDQNLTTYKFSTSLEENIPQIRLAEVILNRAEALARENGGVNVEALGLLNQVRSRALPGATPLTIGDFANKEAFIDRILKERRMELMFESHERYDLIRTGRKSGLSNPNLPDNKLVMPIPQTEVDISKGVIKQNVGYN